MFTIYIRDRTIVNTDPERRCYNGCNYSEKIQYGEWRVFQTWGTLEFAKLVAKGLHCDRYDVKVEENV